jgi:hypothetical protein
MLLSCTPSRQYSLEKYLKTGGTLPVKELTDVPFFPQTRHQCGPAALATVLVYSGVDTNPEKLEPQVFIPGRAGSLTVELVAASRRHGRLPYPVTAGLDNILAEVAAGNPVLVLLNLGFDHFPVWHYAVVAGYDGRKNSLILRSGAERRKVTEASRFYSAWRRAAFWGLVVVPPDRIPDTANSQDFLREAAALEHIGKLNEAAGAFDAALQRWPGNEVALLGLGNVKYTQNDLQAAAAIYLRLVQSLPDSAAGFNNLAHVLTDLQCYDEALGAVRRARSLSVKGDEVGVVGAKTEEEILRKAREKDYRKPCPVPGMK